MSGTGNYYNIDEANKADSAVLATATSAPMVTITAPATLPEGYTLDAVVNGQTVQVAVVSKFRETVCSCHDVRSTHSFTVSFLALLRSHRVASRRAKNSWHLS